MSSLYAIGDIHGELGRLKNLFAKMDLKDDDTVVFLGDYIDRGPDSRGVIDFVIGLRDRCNVVTLKGNHETFAIETFKYLRGEPYHPDYVRSWSMNGGKACLRSYLRDGLYADRHHELIEEMHAEHREFFENLLLTYETENHIFVHGYLNDTLDVTDQDELSCLWGRFDDIKPHKSGKTVVCGHTPSFDPVNLGYKICIDTGSFKSGGCITALHIQGNKERFIDSR